MDAETKTLLCAYYKAYLRANGKEKTRYLKLGGSVTGWFIINTFHSQNIRKSELLKMIETLNSRPAKD
jgi:hypothetical protein